MPRWIALFMALCCTSLAAAGEPADAPAINAKKLFARHCNWCHGAYGMAADKAPRLAGTAMTADEVRTRIRDGVPGEMPGFAQSLSPDQVDALARYIKSLPAAP
jgi:mono/diheme cytochrome c family protein